MSVNCISLLTLVLISGLANAVKINEHVDKSTSNAAQASFLKDLVKKVMGEALPMQDTIFKAVDRDGDGYVSLEDLHVMYLKEAGDVIMNVADMDHDGKLTPLEFFGTTSQGELAGPKVLGNPASGDKAWNDRNFDLEIDTFTGKSEDLPQMCSTEFWQWAAAEWRQRRVNKPESTGDVLKEKANWRDFFTGSDNEPGSWNPSFKLMALHREMSIMGDGRSSSWDLCLNLLPAQKLNKLKMGKFLDWQQCYYKDLNELTKADFFVTQAGSGVPSNLASREKVGKFYDDYYVGDKTDCGIADNKKSGTMWRKSIGRPT